MRTTVGELRRRTMESGELIELMRTTELVESS